MAETKHRSMQFSLRWLLALVVCAAIGAAVTNYFFDREAPTRAAALQRLADLVADLHRSVDNMNAGLDLGPSASTALQDNLPDEDLFRAFGPPDPVLSKDAPADAQHSWTIENIQGASSIRVVFSRNEQVSTLFQTHSIVRGTGTTAGTSVGKNFMTSSRNSDSRTTATLIGFAFGTAPVLLAGLLYAILARVGRRKRGVESAIPPF